MGCSGGRELTFEVVSRSRGPAEPYRYPTEIHPNMSTRTYALSVTSFDPIVQSIASNDPSLVQVVCDAHEDDPDFREFAESMVMVPTPPEIEPGCWNYVVEVLASHFDLSPNRLAIEDWKHRVWHEYLETLAPVLSDSTQSSLRYIRACLQNENCGVN